VGKLGGGRRGGAWSGLGWVVKAARNDERGGWGVGKGMEVEVEKRPDGTMAWDNVPWHSVTRGYLTPLPPLPRPEDSWPTPAEQVCRESILGKVALGGHTGAERAGYQRDAGIPGWMRRP
jgi:hypothetical protein